VSTTDVATPRMISLIGSLADNKSALGHRYGEWAVSAPTIESAVAAAAMAQDELGHARSTYPVLAKLGAARDEGGLDVGHPLPVIAAELPDWASLIAANAVVDGILTTFVAATRESAIEPLAQRARKILQEEGAHRVHAEAWCRRIARAGGSDLELLLARIEEMWAQAARWPGPDGDRGFQQAISAGMVGEGPGAIRDRVRRWLTALLGAEGVSVALPEPVFLGGVECPFCGSSETELVSRFGGQIITSQQRCNSCGTYFEAVRDDFDLSR
jgi:ring-1,2-phenylacetyl-CoA epoxidase subunit PaaC